MKCTDIRCNLLILNKCIKLLSRYRTSTLSQRSIEYSPFFFSFYNFLFNYGWYTVLYQFQHLHTLQCNHHPKFSNYLSPGKLITILFFFHNVKTFTFFYPFPTLLPSDNHQFELSFYVIFSFLHKHYLDPVKSINMYRSVIFCGSYKLLTTELYLQLLLFLITGFCLWAKFFGIDIIQWFSGMVLPPKDSRQYLEIFWLAPQGVGGRELEVLLASCGQRLRMLLSTLQCRGGPHI